MNVNGTFVNFLYQCIYEDPSFSDITFVIAHENEIKPTPLEKPIVALSAKGCTIGDKIVEANASGEFITTNKREVKSKVSVDIYLPYSMGGLEGHKIFDKIATFFLFTHKMNITFASCSETDYDASCQAIVLKSIFEFTNIVEA
jgi:hypothetical protein